MQQFGALKFPKMKPIKQLEFSLTEKHNVSSFYWQQHGLWHSASVSNIFGVCVCVCVYVEECYIPNDCVYVLRYFGE